MDLSEFDFLAKLLAQQFESKISLIVSFDKNEIRINTSYGVSPDQSRDLIAFSSEILRSSKDILVIEDYHQKQNPEPIPLHNLEFNLVFFVGIPFFHEDGSLFGFISLFDDRVKQIDIRQIEFFREVSKRVEKILKEKSESESLQSNELILFGHGSDESPISLFGTEQAINEVKKIEKALRVSEDAFRENFDNAAIGMALLDETGRWLKVNKRVCDILGYSELEFMNLTFQDITHPEDLNADLKYLEELIADKRKFYQMEKRYFQKSGNIVYAILAVSMVKNEEGKILYFISQIIDITEQKLIEKELKLALAKNQAILDSSTLVAIISTDTEGTITEFNHGAEKMLGYTSEELI